MKNSVRFLSWGGAVVGGLVAAFAFLRIPGADQPSVVAMSQLSSVSIAQRTSPPAPQSGAVQGTSSGAPGNKTSSYGAPANSTPGGSTPLSRELDTLPKELEGLDLRARSMDSLSGIRAPQTSAAFEGPDGLELRIIPPQPPRITYLMTFPIEKELDGSIREAFVRMLKGKCGSCNQDEAEKKVREGFQQNQVGSGKPGPMMTPPLSCGQCTVIGMTQQDAGRKMINVNVPQ